MDLQIYTKDEINAANSLLYLNNTLYMDDNLYHTNKEIRNHNRLTVSIHISNFLKKTHLKYNYYFFEKIINCFNYYQKINKENKPRIPPDFLTILWKILIKQQESIDLILSQNVISIMEYDLKILNKSNDEIEIENKIINLYK